MSHCYSRDCLRGSSAADKTTALHDPTTFNAAGCECVCGICKGTNAWLDPMKQDGPIMFLLNGGREMLRLSPEGFFVEGRKVTDDVEVYRMFKEWLTNVTERAAVVAWLRREAKESDRLASTWGPGGTGLEWAAKSIENGEHLKSESK
jgi:hypothetical protein